METKQSILAFVLVSTYVLATLCKGNDRIKTERED